MYGAIPTADYQGMALDSINNALQELARERKWFWWLTEDDVSLAAVATDAKTSDMPANLGRIECILDSDGTPVAAKNASRQHKYPEAIGNSTTQTYAAGGFNSTTRVKTVLWSPVIGKETDFKLWYYRMPALLSADTDIPDLPDEFHDYLYWRAFKMLMLADEERRTLMDSIDREAARIYQAMESEHARIIDTLSGTIYATAP
jgi:hypothetical protein